MSQKFLNRKLNALLWKHYITRKRNLKKTILFIILPLIVILPIWLIRENILGNTIDDMSHYESEAINNEYLYEYIGLKTLLYAPNDSEFYKDLMRKVATKLRFREEDLIGYRDEKTLLKEKGMQIEGDSQLFAVIFNNYESTDRLNYSIRSSPKYNTYKVAPNSIAAEPHDQYSYVYQYLCSVQLAIDTSYIEMKSDRNFDEEILTQPFPYPPYLKDEHASIKYNYLLPITIINSFFIITLLILENIIEEKSTGMKELMRMMGTSTKYFWIAHYIEKLILVFVPVFVITLLLGTSSLIPKTNLFLLFLVIFIYANYVILFSFVISTFFSEVLLASLFIVILWVSSQALVIFETAVLTKFQAIYFLLLIPNVAIMWLFRIIGILEVQQIGVQFSNMFTITKHFPITNFGVILLVLIVISLTFILIIWYMDQVNPGQYGVAKSYNFMFKKPKTSIVDTNIQILKEIMYMEKFEHQQPAIMIKDVTKVFMMDNNCKNIALNNVNFDIYKTGITALLGHNGAGKTTLISIITGMQPPTEGDIIIDGYSIKKNTEKIHKRLGLCPQNNMTFNDLTVKEHIEFFGKMQGLSSKDSIKNCESVLEKLNLTDKSNELCKNLSGGGQRRVQLAIALAGKAPFIILDEPTSGLDPENRRQLWDILLELRKTHTILLTTHFMEEADILGDRIAILDNGNLKCYGTPIFLKQRICPGYKLTLLKLPEANDIDISDTIENKFEYCKKIDIEDDTIKYELKGNPHDLIIYLENCGKRLGIESFEITTFTMEDVFFRICDGIENVLEEFLSKEIEHEKEAFTPKEKINPISKNFLQYEALILRKFIYMKKNLRVYIPLLLLSILLIILSMSLNNTEENIPINAPINLNLSLYQRDKTIFYSSDNIQPEKFIPNVNFTPVDDVNDAILKMGEKNISRYKEDLLIGLSLKNNKYHGYYSISVYHAMPAVINLITNIIAAKELNLKPESYPYITTINDPIEKNLTNIILENSVKSLSSIMAWAFFTSLGWSIYTLIFISYPIKERISQSKNLQYLTGVTGIQYWLVLLFIDFLVCGLFLISVIALCFDNIGTFTNDMFGPVLTLECLYILSVLMFKYAISFSIKNPITGYVYFMVINSLCCFFSLMVYSFSINGDKIIKNLRFMTIFPSFTLDYGLLKIGHIARERMLCIKYHESKYGNMSNVEKICCDMEEGRNETCIGLTDYYFDHNYGIIFDVIMLIVMFIVYLIILFIREYKMYDKLKVNYMEKKHFENTDEELGTNFGLKVQNIGKLYTDILKRNNEKALNSLNINLSKGDCFGLIGVNGSGKSTTFNILTGNIPPSTGNIKNGDRSLKKTRTKYLKLLSYCPQFDAIGDYLTARQALILYCKLRKVPRTEIDREVTRFLHLSGLKKLADIPSYQYSGGNKRKLSLAVALVGLKYIKDPTAAIILLDEPTTGVDPKSRQLIHKMIEMEKKSDRTIIFSSHSLNECESLCNKVGLLIKGEMQYSDTIQKVKKNLGSGYTLTIKLKSKSMDEADSSRNSDNLDIYEKRDELKSLISKIPDIELKDEHETVIKYYIFGSKYDELFLKMENIKLKLGSIIEDYALCNFTLEEVFINYNRKSRNKEENV